MHLSSLFKNRPLAALLAAFLIVLSGCGGNIVLDNPRNEKVTFAFDGNNAHEVGPGASSSISLEPGEHAVEVRGASGQVLADTTFNLKEDGEGLVHSGASNYLVWRQLYGLQDNRKTLLNEMWVEFDSVKAFGDIKVYPKEWIFIEKIWNLDLDDEMPDAKTLYMTSDFKIETKVFRSSDFIDTYKRMSQLSK
jgi:hypothetical protein